MTWIAFASGSSWSKYIWLSKSKEFFIECREFVKAKAKLTHPNGLATDSIEARILVRVCMREINLDYPTRFSVNSSASDWYNICRAVLEKIKIADGDIFDTAERSLPGQKYQIYNGLFDKQQQPKKTLSDINQNVNRKKILDRMANFSAKKSKR